MVVSLLCYIPFEVRAEKEKPVDLILVLDQSGSMESNDPSGMMREAANMLIEMMPTQLSRVGVISFNRKQTKVAELTDLTMFGSVTALVDKVKAIPYKGGTDIGNAVAEAVEMFSKDDEREHAILVLSDGRNDFGVDKNAEQRSDERLYNALVEAERQGCNIYCLGFGAEMANVNDTPYKKLAGIATSAEHVSTETEPGKIHDFFVNILADLFDSIPMPIYENSFTIEPNVKEANVYLSSISDLTNVDISLEGPDGNTISLENNESVWFYKSKYSAVIKLFTPNIGKYTIRTSDENISIVSLGYIPLYEYTLSSSMVDSLGNKVEKIDNQATVEIQTVIQQDEKDIAETSVYDSTDATAVVIAKDTGETVETVKLTYQNGKLSGKVALNRVATYQIDISVKSSSFNLEDQLEITTNQRAISIGDGTSTKQIEKKTIDKTFKKKAELTVDNKELFSIISDPDEVGVTIEKAISYNPDKVTAQITDDGILLTGLKWGSSIVKVEYKDGLGNTVQTSFVVKVQDKLLVAFFAILPILIIAVVLLIVYFVMKQSRMINGEFELSKVTITPENGEVVFINARRSYRGKMFAGRQKTFGNGVATYAREVYSMDSTSPSHVQFYKMFTNNQTEMRQILDMVQLIGTYLGRKGCSIKVKKGANVSVTTNRAYGKPVKMAWSTKVPIKIYAKDTTNTEICIEGSYNPQLRNKSPRRVQGQGVGGQRTNQPVGNPKTNQNNGFDDFFS